MNAPAQLDPEVLALLRESTSRFGQQHYTFERRRAFLASKSGYDVHAWREYAALGWLAVPLPAAHSGCDGEPGSIGVLMEYVGSALALEPVLASAVMCGRILARCAATQADPWLRAIAAGEQVFALAHGESVAIGVEGGVRTACRDGHLSGTKHLVLHGDAADRLIVSARRESDGALAMFCVDPRAAGVSARSYRLVDGRGAASFEFRDVLVEPIDTTECDAARVIDDALDDARLALCAETFGAVRALNDATTDYLKTRKQFGRPLGTNQALQHRMVDLFILQEELRAVIDAAYRACAGPAHGRVRAIAGASAHAATVARQTAHEAVQLHGGMGMTAELPVSHYFKRLMVTTRLLGDREAQLRRFAIGEIS